MAPLELGLKPFMLEALDMADWSLVEGAHYLAEIDFSKEQVPYNEGGHDRYSKIHAILSREEKKGTIIPSKRKRPFRYVPGTLIRCLRSKREKDVRLAIIEKTYIRIAQKTAGTHAANEKTILIYRHFAKAIFAQFENVPKRCVVDALQSLPEYVAVSYVSQSTLDAKLQGLSNRGKGGRPLGKTLSYQIDLADIVERNPYPEN